MFQKGDKNITGDVKIGGKADRLEDVLDPFRCTPLGESQNFRSARDHVHAGRRRFPVGQAEMRIADVEEDIDHELVSKEQIDAKIHEMAALASEDYRDKNPLLVAVLKGAVNTLVAFTQAMSIPVQIDFMSLSSYGSGTVSSGEVTVRQDLSADVRGRHILIVEDIVDSGRTLAWLVAELKRRGAASVEVFALLSKPSRREVDVDVKYAGYEIPDEFVVGFGLDFDERYRNLDSIAVLKPSVYQGVQA